VLDSLRAKKENTQHGSATMSSVFFFGEFLPLGDQKNWKKNGNFRVFSVNSTKNANFLWKNCQFTYLTKLEKKTLTMSKNQRNL